ncbi:hypothetical protein ACP4OV_004768 [Aristida adscensionis]
MARGPAKKRRREPSPPAGAAARGERKLLTGEHVEVFSSDSGLCGSWHQAVIIDVSENARTVRYTDFIDENGTGLPLVENVQVSDAIDGKSSMPGEFTYRNVRPLHPHEPLQISDASYGLCVDALLEGSYWEGVIADHAEGSMERKIIFPDEGDECIMAVDQLRCTQDWDEVTGKWKPRGIWFFLQSILSHEEKYGLPVSVRQIWYDLRSKPSFRAGAKMWMCGTEAFWERSLAALIDELWTLCGKPSINGDQVEAYSGLAEGSSLVVFQNDKADTIVMDKLNPIPAEVSDFIFYYRNNDRKSAFVKKELAKKHLKSLGWTIVDDRPKNKYYVSPDGKRFPSLLGACEAYLAHETIANQDYHTNGVVSKNSQYNLTNMDLTLKENKTNNKCITKASQETIGKQDYHTNGVVSKNSQYNLINMDLALKENVTNNKCITKASTSWESVKLDAQFSPQIASFIADYNYQNDTSLLQRRIDKAISLKLKMHLLALGWSIQFKVDEISADGQPKHITRYRYESPDRKTYFSVIQVIRSFIVGSIKQVTRSRTADIPENLSYLAAPKEDLHATVLTDLPSLRKRKGENKSYALGKYIDYMEADKQNSRIRKMLRSNAKKFLKSAGWKFWLKQKSRNKVECRYDAPHGKSYKSLVAACKGYLEKGYQENNDARFEMTDPASADSSMHLSRLIALSGGLRDSTGKQDSVGHRSSDMFTVSTRHGKYKKRKSSSLPLDHARVLCSRHERVLPCQHRAKTVFSLLIEKNILLPRDKLTYKQKSDGPGIKEGSISRDGIKCMCCNEIFTMENFEVHAGSSTPLPSAHMFLKDGRSLSQCLIEFMGRDKPSDSWQVRLKGKYSDLESDSICSVCHDGGEILLCDNCPSSYHHDCVGLEATPEGSWYCPSCKCSICNLSDYDPDASQFTEKTIMFCDQCEREYHVGCVQNRDCRLIHRPEGYWLCSGECSKIFQHLQRLIGKSVPTAVEGFSCTILRFYKNGCDHGDYNNAIMAEYYGKLRIALDVLHECFVTIIEPRTQSDLSEDIVFGRESELRRLNFRGFYTILLEKSGELVSVGTFRVCGMKFAELPLIGTRVPYRRLGMCRLLMNELEKLLSDLGVERLLLPAVPQLLGTWTGSFGFTAMSNSDRLELAENSVLSFQGTTMCQKVLNAACNNPKDCSVPSMFDSEIKSLAQDDLPSSDRIVCDKVANNSSDRLELLNATMISTADRELAENSMLYSPGTNICQKDSTNAQSHPAESDGFVHQLEDASIIGETLENDGPERNSVSMEDMEVLEPELVLEIQSNSGEEAICSIDVPTSKPDPQVSFTGDKYEQPYDSADADQCSENCALTEVKTVTQNAVLAPRYKFSGKCYKRMKNSSRRRNFWLGVSIK